MNTPFATANRFAPVSGAVAVAVSLNTSIIRIRGAVGAAK